MAELDIRQTDTTESAKLITDYSVMPQTTDAAGEQKETTWVNSKFSKYLGYYKEIPELKKAVDALATWILGKGYTVDNSIDKSILENISGWGEDSFNSLLWNLIVTKKIAGDAFAEIIRNDKGTLVNLKPLDPAVIKTVVDKKGRIKRYEQLAKSGKGKPKKYEPTQILHLCNDRIGDEILLSCHYISVESE